MTEESDSLRALLEEAIGHSDADETQVAFGGGRLHVTRFANNRLTAGVEERWARLTMRGAWWQPNDRWLIGEAASTELLPKGLVRLARWTRDAATVRPATSDYLRLPFAGEFESMLADVSDSYDAGTAASGPSLSANTVAELALPCLRRGFTCEGFLAVAVGTIGLDGDPGMAALANVNGLFHYYKPTRVALRARVRGPSGGIGRVDTESAGFRSLRLDASVALALERAELPHRPSALDAGRVRVLLEPTAVASLLELLRPHFALANVRVDDSPFAARVDTRVFGPEVDIALDPAHPLLGARPFDHEGWPRRVRPVIEGGVLRPLLVTRSTTSAADRSQDGYSEMVNGVSVAVPRHPVLRGGNADRDALLAALGDGLIVGRLRGTALAPPNSFRVTAMTGDDVYLVRGGRIEARVGSLRLVGDLSRILGPDTVLGEPVRVWPSVAPPIVADGFEAV